jgi:hypothetical protein
MFQRPLQVLYAIEFLIALIAVYTVWSTVGEQVHLDYMAWYWKAGIGFPAAFAVVRLTIAFGADDFHRLRRMVGWILLLVLLAVCAGLVTYYYHLNEPQDQNDPESGTITPAALHVIRRPAAGPVFQRSVCRRRSLSWLPSRRVHGAVGIGTCAVARAVAASATG